MNTSPHPAGLKEEIPSPCSGEMCSLCSYIQPTASQVHAVW